MSLCGVTAERHHSSEVKDAHPCYDNHSSHGQEGMMHGDGDFYAFGRM